ncbi:MAG: PEPxxWA-CTERM sorting domain-containing protein [Alphaproteobacteria bacterium]|nr:PEPxxWA-CTERM sorting domain-containing protein [Alphaproteobacteria bacterium]MBU1514044.1 PEPxxWA-CTERM sorting domain-containing protein [Alphaproteobacteria bacterium]MBU2093016.1 PEPxxWA-CTERM sorting domain-containing protein [Alphaproteobacteria bacterium]MBU2151781.1 PEPxxWA-CTERM sorting domain-containing protein [Alphaproteobacteria bacterium]MBU2309399.1 PEPxxWA-CTERM sorting domain-containing protein [Alphaproteobacteria bacterium]
MFKSFAAVAAGAMLLAVAPAASASVFVGAAVQTPTFLAELVAGQSYTVTATGVANIYVGGALDFDPDGRPTHPIGGVYAPFNTPGCCYADPSSPSVFGYAGTNAFLGALAGTFSASPSGPSAYFQLGSSYQFVASADGALYGLVNDAVNAYGDNGAQTGFNVTVTADASPDPTAVPEPSSWALMILGFGGAGAMIRRRKVLAA